ncbi:hypothetical protein, partial [Vespertiliibacter pulmonis]|uniref:hypothetical protein n=1 Tax=Vespertiliibacter pulmonis TaxID=1443036 RepID=UPI001B86F00B
GSVGIPHVRVGHHQGFIDNPKVERPWGFCYGEIIKVIIGVFYKQYQNKKSEEKEQTFTKQINLL